MTEFVIGEPMMDKAEAKAKAKAKAKQLKRDTITAVCSVIGDPSIRAGMGLQFRGVRAGVDGTPFVITTASHKYSKQGYTTSIDGELKV